MFEVQKTPLKITNTNLPLEKISNTKFTIEKKFQIQNLPLKKFSNTKFTLEKILKYKIYR